MSAEMNSVLPATRAPLRPPSRGPARADLREPASVPARRRGSAAGPSRGPARPVARPAVAVLPDGTPVFAPIGEVLVTDTRVVCHLCGRALRSVTAHLRVHG
jgi:hypothetical protein